MTGGTNGAIRDAKGVGLLRDWSFAREDRVIAPLDDGTVCVWDMNYSHSSCAKSQKGKITGMSSPGILLTDMSKRNDKTAPLEFLNVGECVTVDSMRRRAYIAVGNILNEVDLETLRVVHQQRYAWSIFALSQETDYSVPLTLATTLSLQIYDARLSSPEEEAEISLRCERMPAQYIPKSNLYSHPDCQVLQLLPNGQLPQRIRSPDPHQKGADYAPLFQPGPLSILHPPTPHVNTILLAGRFPSILCYDRRTFPKIQSAIHSGGRLCGLASVPAPRFPVSSNFDWQVKHTVVACGEYNGRGSLELYDLNFHGSDPQDENSESHMQSARYQNRQSAASSKVLSVASHGARIVFSDSNGDIKWVERDGRTPVRRHWNINISRRQSKIAAPGNNIDESDQVRGLFFTSDTSMRNDVVRKILPTDANLNGDELLLWTEDRIGRLRFSNDPDEDTDDEIHDRMSLDGKLVDAQGRPRNAENKNMPVTYVGHLNDKRMSGYVCAPILPSHADKLLLPQMVINNADPLITAYTISIDSNDPSVTTGISAHDRALTCRQLADPNIKSENFRRPGHILPLRAREGGVRERRGHTEAAIDLCRLAGRSLAGVIGELVEEGDIVEGVAEVKGNNGMMRRDACLKFGKRFGLKVTTIEDMVAYLDKLDPNRRFDFVNGKA
ncbi:conserved hypothetical protein [Talaromyces stipitatus ATCC 10500]|uniref:Uncharacterized protein n=1 Tax=Talaromyces stipitatus (strain ATCC 10500 / CBS 375.48 / QM 6759 / NRRL 1006) TaxID=441959 RepID=B8MAI4_TALSN|nr:uncharacterized protein TSTA_112420 [Talaromyces stipitatus ATCC 10500]EED17408.1 conserved hypothetical protein [Talaromyces stipitatus ATCC 10500]